MKCLDIKRFLVSALAASTVLCACPLQGAEFTTLEITDLFNADLFTTVENRTDGQVDSGRSSIPAEMMPPSETVFRTAGIDFLFPSKEDGRMNAVRGEGQTIDVSGIAADYLYVLATAADGNQREHIILKHEDGTEYSTPMDVNDWCAENPGLGGLHGLVSDYRHTLGGKQICKTSLWVVPVRLRSASPLTSITLPNNPNVFIVALSLGPAGEERRIQTYIKDAFFPSQEAGIDRLVLLQVLEPTTNARLRVLADDDWQEDYREIAAFDLKGGVESLPVWLPVMKKRTYHFDIGGEHFGVLDETNLFVNCPRAMIRLKATKPAHAADVDLGMAPAWQITVLPDTGLNAELHIPDGPADQMILRSVITPKGSGGHAVIAEQKIPIKKSGAATVTCAVDTGGLQPGDYAVDLSLVLHGLPYASEHFLLKVADPLQVDRPFGAREAELSYDGPVWTNWSESISWEDAWVGFTNKDIVIDFPGTSYRYVFWKGASYAPIWLFDRHFITLEWLEAWPRQEGAVDCVEPLQDKECKYSRVELLSTTPARARVRWTYAETDFNLKIIEGEHAEEIYTMYPDGIGVRKVTGFFEKGRWHECVEFIVGSAAGTTPAEHYPPNAASLLNCDGDRLDLYWPTPQDSDLPEWSEYIGVSHSRRNPSVFLATAGYGTGLHVFSNNPDWLSEMFFCMPHWPIQRGLPTTNEQSIEDCYNRATHASLLNIYAGPQELYKDRTIWALLLGIAPDDEKEMRDLVHGWLYPPALTAGEKAYDYDVYQRAYVVDAAEESEFSLLLAAAEENPQIRPAILLKDAAGVTDMQVSINGEDLASDDFSAGLEDGGLVVWLNRSFYESATVQISLTLEASAEEEKEGVTSVDVIGPSEGDTDIEKPGLATSATASPVIPAVEADRGTSGNATVTPRT